MLEWCAEADLLDGREHIRHPCNHGLSETRVTFKVPHTILIMRFDCQDFKQSWEDMRAEFPGDSGQCQKVSLVLHLWNNRPV